MAVMAFLVQVTLHKTVSPSASVVVIAIVAAMDLAAEHQVASLTFLVSPAHHAAQQPQIPGRTTFQLFRVSLAT